MQNILGINNGGSYNYIAEYATQVGARVVFCRSQKLPPLQSHALTSNRQRTLPNLGESKMDTEALVGREPAKRNLSETWYTAT